MATTDRKEYMPPMPEIGHPEGYYAQRAQQAERMGDKYAQSAYKVGQYITLALGRELNWREKLKFFQHTLDRHCQTKPPAPESVLVFYQNLADLVRHHAGQEAVRMAEAENKVLAKRLDMGQSREVMAIEAGRFYGVLLGEYSTCPAYFNQEEYARLKEMRRQWVVQQPSHDDAL